MTNPQMKPTVNLTHSQATRIARGHGLFKRQYLNLLTMKRFDSIHLSWDDVKRSVRQMKADGTITEEQAKALCKTGRDALDEHVQVLALELERYGLLKEYLRHVIG